MRVGLIALATLIVACGCADPKAANKANFTNVIKAHLEGQALNCIPPEQGTVEDYVATVELWSYDRTKYWWPSVRPESGVAQSEYLSMFFVDIGIFVRTDTEGEIKPVKQPVRFSLFKRYPDVQNEKVIVTKFGLSDDAKKLITNNALCFGKYRFIEVLDWTDPATDAIGVIVTNVRAKYAYEYLAQIQIQPAERQRKFLDHVHGEIEEKSFRLIRKNDGWSLASSSS